MHSEFVADSHLCMIQVVTHLARYFDVQLRYPIRQMASRSFIQDYCPAIEPPAVDAVTVTVAPQYGSHRTVVEFPLFSEGQDPTRSAYAVFLLNKVIHVPPQWSMY